MNITCCMLYITAVSGQMCTSADTVGSLDHDGMIITAERTYILTGYTVQCEGIVTTWEFCYQILGTPSVTFYPGIWGITGNTGVNNEYSCIQSNTVTFTPNGTSTFSCQNYTLPVTEQFTAPSGSIVGLYSNNFVQLLHTNSNTSIITYQVNGNQSSVQSTNGRDIDYNIAIRVHLGKLLDLVVKSFVYILHTYMYYTVCSWLNAALSIVTEIE